MPPISSDGLILPDSDKILTLYKIMDETPKKLTHISVPAEHNPLLQQVLERVNSNEEILTLWDVMNVNAIDRLKMSDHGIVHFQIVANMALRIARLLQKHDIPLSIIKDHRLTHNHGEVVIFLASIFHDLGMSISRENHEEYSLIVASPILKEVLSFLPVRERTILVSETLHAIIMHRAGGKPYTIEAGIVRVSDALDMSEGRSRIPFEAGEINIHSISAAAIDTVKISEGENKPIKIDIFMNNSAGVFQLDDLLNSKIKGSHIEDYVEIKAFIEAETEKKLLKEFKVS